MIGARTGGFGRRTGGHNVEIHKPKPIQGWRDFFSEMTVIVCGIAIALGGEQLIEALHWHYEVKETESRLATELLANAAEATLRVRTAPCVDKRLDEIAGVIDDAAKSGKLPPIGYLGQPYLYLWGHGTWDSAVASQTATHFPAQRLANFSIANQFLVRLGELNLREMEAWTELSAIVGPGRPFDTSAADAARLATGRARLLGREMRLLSGGLLDRVKALNLPHQTSARLAELNADAHQPLSRYLICRPIGTEISPTYGQAPLL